MAARLGRRFVSNIAYKFFFKRDNNSFRNCMTDFGGHHRQTLCANDLLYTQRQSATNTFSRVVLLLFWHHLWPRAPYRPTITTICGLQREDNGRNHRNNYRLRIIISSTLHWECFIFEALMESVVENVTRWISHQGGFTWLIYQQHQWRHFDSWNFNRCWVVSRKKTMKNSFTFAVLLTIENFSISAYE